MTQKPKNSDTLSGHVAPENVTEHDTPEYQAFMADCAKRCRCSTAIVCASVLQGGPCEDIQEDDRGVERYFDDEDED